MKIIDISRTRILDDPIDWPDQLGNLTNDSIVWVNDVWNESELTEVLQNQQPKYIISDHFSSIELLKHQVYAAPLFLSYITNEIVKNLPMEQQYQTKYIFNFMCNKKQVNRFLCMKLVELFNLKSYDYTWSGFGSPFDMQDIIAEWNHLGNKLPLSTQQKSELLGKIKMPPKFFGNDIITKNSRIGNPSLSWTWNQRLNKIFCNSAVSLITESLSFEKSTVFTEKTTYAILGKTFPLWVGGGSYQAQYFEEMGFDVFHDVIDHSYQCYDTLIERCYYAFEKNLHLLSDYNYATNMRETHIARLEHNWNLLTNQHVDKFCKQKIKQWPTDLQEAITDGLKLWL